VVDGHKNYCWTGNKSKVSMPGGLVFSSNIVLSLKITLYRTIVILNVCRKDLLIHTCLKLLTSLKKLLQFETILRTLNAELSSASGGCALRPPLLGSPSTQKRTPLFKIRKNCLSSFQSTVLAIWCVTMNIHSHVHCTFFYTHSRYGIKC